MTSLSQSMPDDLDHTCPLDEPSETSIQYHLEIANEERARNGFPPHERITPQTRSEALALADATLDALAGEIERLSTCSVRPFPTPEERHKRQVDELFTSTKEHERYFSLQSVESLIAADVADLLAGAAFGADCVDDIDDRRQQAHCRFAAVHAIRVCKDEWRAAAMEHAIERCAEVMRTEAGARFRGCSQPELESLSRLIAPRVICAYLGITEGTLPMTPGKYLSIVNGGQR